MIVRLSLVLLVALFIFATMLFLPQCRADLPAVAVLHTFTPGGPGDLIPSHDINSDGSHPEASLMQGQNGVLYGTTQCGGSHGTGVVFKINIDGTGFAILHSFGPLAALFVNETNADGCWPEGALVFGKDNALYGVTGQGGPGGSGTVVKLNPDGSGFTVLHSFEPKGELFHNNGGAHPVGLTAGTDQTLFGVAELGGYGQGLIFNLTQDGKNFHVIHSFDDPAQEDNVNDGGAIPSTAVLLGRDGALYGTTNVGGKQGYDVIYKVDADGKHFTVLHHFRRKGGDYKNNGAFPNGSLRVSQDNFLYGCTRQGGAFDSGIVYKQSADGTVFTVLHTFSNPTSDNADGSIPAGPLVFGNDGRLYGLTSSGGEGGVGVLFGISPDGNKFFALHNFSVPDGQMHNIDGGFTLTGLTLGRDGNLYGVSGGGGSNGSGTIFCVTFPKTK